MTRHIVNALLNLAFLMAVNRGAAQQAVSKGSDEALVTTQKTSHVVSKSSVPLFPTVAEKAADLVQPCGIPGLCDELSTGERRVRFDIPQYRRIRHYFAEVAASEDR